MVKLKENSLRGFQVNMPALEAKNCLTLNRLPHVSPLHFVISQIGIMKQSLQLWNYTINKYLFLRGRRNSR